MLRFCSNANDWVAWLLEDLVGPAATTLSFVIARLVRATQKKMGCPHKAGNDDGEGG